MSTLTVSKLAAPLSSGNKINLEAGTQLIIPGTVLQCQITRYDGLTTYATGTSASGVELSVLRVSITPKVATSMILCQFFSFGEGASTHNYVYNVYKDGAVPTGTYAGYNTTNGNQTYSGIAMALPYETDYNSTPFGTTFFYHDFPGDTSAHTYAPGVKESSGTNYTWYVNRTVGSAGAGGSENGVSFSIAWEIAQ
jgi:hypothetical protein